MIVGNNNDTVTNCYYRNCDGNGYKLSNAFTISAGEDVTVTVNSYNYGIEYNGTLYAPEDAEVSLNLGFTGVLSNLLLRGINDRKVGLTNQPYPYCS